MNSTARTLLATFLWIRGSLDHNNRVAMYTRLLELFAEHIGD